MSVQKINARLSISYPTRGRDDEDGKVISIRIDCKDSRIEFVDLEVSYEEFTAALSGLQYRPASSCKVRGLEKVGKKHEYECFKIYTDIAKNFSYNEKEALGKALCEEAEKLGWTDGGWEIGAYIALNSQGGHGKDEKGEWFSMSRVRWV